MYVDVLMRTGSAGGGADLDNHTAQRDAYLNALRAADAHDITPLLQFATS